LKTAVTIVEQKARELGNESWLDQLGEAGVALRQWRGEIISDLGGEESITAMERALVETLTRSYLILESIDRYLVSLPSVVNKQKHATFTVVMQRQQLADSLARNLERLGLRRRAKEVTLAQWLRKPEEDDEGTTEPSQGAKIDPAHDPGGSCEES
jgi:hypothetical protein